MSPSNVVPLRSTAISETDKAIASWLRRTQVRVGLSYSAWARAAGLADTTLTRFLRHGAPTPRMKTLEALARYAGVQPPHVALSAELQPFVDIPVILGSIAASKGWAAARAGDLRGQRPALEPPEPDRATRRLLHG